MENYIKRLIIRMLLLLFVIFFSKDLFYPVLEFLTIKLSHLFLLPSKQAVSYVSGIVPACIAFSAYVLLAILILVTRDISHKKAFKMFIFGSLLILIINAIRIDLLIYALVFMGSSLYETVHLFFWKVLSGVVVVLIWIYLTRKYHIKEIPVYSDVKYLIRKIR